MNGSSQTIEVWGELACFTRPELKVERYSYPAMTPSSARGIFDSIYWKPGFYWQVETIRILNPIQYITLKRNEVKDKVPSDRTIRAWIRGTKTPEPIFADGTGSDNKGRTQRQTMALKGVRYIITAKPIARSSHDIHAINAQFKRRASMGKCFQRPYLGCREFIAFFKYISEPDSNCLDIDMEIGWMTYDIFDLSSIGQSQSRMFSIFWADISNGIMKIPPFESERVKKEIPREMTR